jgi:hypothetical protein
MLELPESILQALDARGGNPLTALDPRTNQEYVVISTELWERILPDTPDDWEGVDVGALMAAAMREDDENDPALESYQKYKESP